MQHRRVIAPAERIADLRQAVAGEFLRERHCYLTRPGNYLGLCGLSMPSGLSRGLPVGIQILGKPYAEHDVIKFGKAFQDATDFHRRAPDLSSLGL